MNTTDCQILLIMKPEENNPVNIQEFLTEKGFEVFRTKSANEGILKARESYPDLIICQNQLDERTGLQVYNALNADLLKRNTPFFLYMPEYNKSDVLIGLETGVDSFVITPFDKDTLNKKVTHHLNKVQQSRIIDSEQFRKLFDTTPVAKFISEYEQITVANKALQKLTGITGKYEDLPKIEEVFDFTEDEKNALELQKCLNGIKEYSLLKSVPVKTNKSVKVDIQFVYTDYFGKAFFIGEVVPVNGKINGRELKGDESDNQNFESKEDDTFNLTAREMEVLEWSAQGLPIKQIATILKISDRTVEKHRANIMRKTDASSIIEAIYAVQRKM